MIKNIYIKNLLFFKKKYKNDYIHKIISFILIKYFKKKLTFCFQKNFNIFKYNNE